MTVRFKILVLVLVFAGLSLGGTPIEQGADLKLKLSEYGFFVGNMADLIPTGQVFPYEVNAPLFSDYAQKARFIYLPEGQQMIYSPGQPFEFPNGSVLIKNFFYWHDERSPEKGRRILETRLLMRTAAGWKALEYLWNTDQTEATLEVAGGSFPLSRIDEKGNLWAIEYIAPNLNQCKGCHSYDGQFVPIGITARQLNRDQQGENQLVSWVKNGRLLVPSDFNPDQAQRLTDYRLPISNQAKNQPTNPYEPAARAYLDGNCAHCHNPHGPASTSGMFLEFDQTAPDKLGIGKSPVAAGRGSGNRRFGIVPGKPNESILVFRMESDDPGIRMPELGRQTQHIEGVDIIKAWIKAM